MIFLLCLRSSSIFYFLLRLSSIFLWGCLQFCLVVLPFFYCLPICLGRLLFFVSSSSNFVWGRLPFFCMLSSIFIIFCWGRFPFFIFFVEAVFHFFLGCLPFYFCWGGLPFFSEVFILVFPQQIEVVFHFHFLMRSSSIFLFFVEVVFHFFLCSLSSRVKIRLHT